MPPNLLLMAKLLVVLGWLHGSFGRLEVPFLPWLQVLDVLRPWAETTGLVLRSVYVVATVLLLVNVLVRAACVTLGLVLTFALLASRPGFHNHLLLPAVLLFLAGLHRPAERPELIPLQFGLMYFGAAIDKLASPDWPDGRVMQAFMTEPMLNPVFGVLGQVLSELAAARLLTWGAILTEAGLVVMFVVPRLRWLAVWVTIGFHGGLWVMLAGNRFGFFLENILVGLLAFLTWPKAGLELAVAPRLRGVVGAWLRSVHWGAYPARIGSCPPDDGSWLVVRAGERVFRNESGVRHVLHYSAGFYIFLFGLDLVTGRMLGWKWKFLFDAAGALALLAFFLPLPWRRSSSRGPGR